MTGRRASSSSSTGVFCHSEWPRSACSALPTQLTYCSSTGLSRPSAATIWSRLFLSAATSFWLIIKSMTSPGIMRIVMNTITVATSNVGTNASSRRAR